MATTLTTPTYPVREHYRLYDAIDDARRMVDLHGETFWVYIDNFHDGGANHVGYSVTNAVGIEALGIEPSEIVGTVETPLEYPVDWRVAV